MLPSLAQQGLEGGRVLFSKQEKWQYFFTWGVCAGYIGARKGAAGHYYPDSNSPLSTLALTVSNKLIGMQLFLELEDVLWKTLSWGLILTASKPGANRLTTENFGKLGLENTSSSKAMSCQEMGGKLPHWLLLCPSWCTMDFLPGC